MYDKKVPEVPTLNVNSIINRIDKKIMQLTNDEKESIAFILEFHGCEPSSAAERISDELGVSYESIYDLL